MSRYKDGRVICDGCGVAEGANTVEIEDGNNYLRDLCPECNVLVESGTHVGPNTSRWQQKASKFTPAMRGAVVSAINTLAADTLRSVADLLVITPMPPAGTPQHKYIMDTFGNMGHFLLETADEMRREGEGL